MSFGDFRGTPPWARPLDAYGVEYDSEREAWGECDRCGATLFSEDEGEQLYVHGQPLVCRDCAADTIGRR